MKKNQNKGGPGRKPLAPERGWMDQRRNLGSHRDNRDLERAERDDGKQHARCIHVNQVFNSALHGIMVLDLPARTSRSMTTTRLLADGDPPGSMRTKHIHTAFAAARLQNDQRIYAGRG